METIMQHVSLIDFKVFVHATFSVSFLWKNPLVVVCQLANRTTEQFFTRRIGRTGPSKKKKGGCGRDQRSWKAESTNFDFFPLQMSENPL